MFKISKFLICVAILICSMWAQDIEELRQEIAELKSRITETQNEIYELSTIVEGKQNELKGLQNNSSQGSSPNEKKLDDAIKKLQKDISKANSAIKKIKDYLNKKGSSSSNQGSSSSNQGSSSSNQGSSSSNQGSSSSNQGSSSSNQGSSSSNQGNSSSNQGSSSSNQGNSSSNQGNSSSNQGSSSSNQGSSSSVTLTAAQIQKIKEIDAEKKLRVDFNKIVTENKCGECHKKEKEVWEKTPHNLTFDLMSKRPKAKSIFKNLGESGTIKRSDRCVDCHFTQAEERGRAKAVSGISCESCHGAGKEWIYIHNDRTVPKDIRRKNAMSKGMNNPEDIYLIAQNCYQCHTVPDEELVNKGGHKAGSDNFEFVAWSQGMIRHNFVRTDNNANAETAQNRLRIMFVTGAMLDLEYSLRGLAEATQQGEYLKKMMSRVDLAYRRLKAIQGKASNVSELNELLALFGKLNLRPGNKNQLLIGASLVTLKAREFTKNHDGNKLAVLDSVLPPKNNYINKPSRND